MKKIIIAMAAMLFLAAPLTAELIFLKDGRIIKGTIVSDTAGAIAVRTENRSVERIARRNIMRVLYTDIYLGKVYVQRTDGKNFIGYMVAEDSESYTFRMDISKPQEFRLRRDQVLFMARGNPTGLEGTAGTETVELTWFAPYIPVTKYRVYYKTSREREYTLAGEPWGRSFTLRGLSSNTAYVIHVTAIDRDGDETLPSNEISLTTTNIPPSPPANLTVVQDEKGPMTLTWDEAVDPDGTVRLYRIYGTLKGEKQLLGATRGTSYTIQKPGDMISIHVVALDDRGDESSPVYVGRSGEPYFIVSIQPQVMMPVVDFAYYGTVGFGGSVQFSARHAFVPGLALGFDVSYYYLFGKDNMAADGQKINELHLITAAARVGYVYEAPRYLTVVPYIGAGAAYRNMSYAMMDRDLWKIGDAQTVFDVVPAVQAGAAFEVALGERFVLGLSLNWGMFIEAQPLHYIGLGIVAGVRF